MKTSEQRLGTKDRGPLLGEVEMLPSIRAQRRPNTKALVWPVFALSQLIGSCAGKNSLVAPGVSESGAHPVESSASPAPSAARWERFGQLASMVDVGIAGPSKGQGTGDWGASVRGGQEVTGALSRLHPGKQMPPGTVLVELHTNRLDQRPVDGFAMEKRDAGYFPAGGDWEYVVFGPDGMVSARGKLGFCARCHAEAPADFVFVPKPQK